MFKKIILTFGLTVLMPVFAIDRAELNLNFFSEFNDKCLENYINQALNNNHDLKTATLRVDEYRTKIKYSFANELPAAGVYANYLGIKVPQLDNFELQKNAFILPFMANYEADLFLKNHDKTGSVKKSYEAEKYKEKAVYIALLSDVASSYTNILRYDKLIAAQEKSVDFAEQIMDRNQRKYEWGVINSAELNSSIQKFEDCKNNLANMEKERAALICNFAVLCGINPNEPIARGKLDDFEYSGNIPAELTSDVIFARPDVMQAEKNLEKAKIDVRIARKEFLPRFNITGVWAFNTIAPGTFFSWESSLAMILAGASQDIFTGGRKIANLKIQKTRYEELFEQYRQTDLNAVKEVNTTLCLIKQDTKIDNNTINKFNLEVKKFSDAQQKYNRGVISYPDYLQNAQNYLLVQEENANTKSQRIADYITLYKVSGANL